ncbi:hypothetical protein EDD21DRAFT_420357 [Dissophora ornata]|nr:hypothetical protein EDD21DRAFT_420357 [Dissophora ornata]
MNVINLREHKDIVLNATSAPSGDAFLSLDSGHVSNEVHQYKFYSGKSTINQQTYNNERGKAASAKDFFILFTTQVTHNINLPWNSGIVDRACWYNYFGPFAARAYVYCDIGLPNTNRADFTTLQLVQRIGIVRAQQIMELRQQKPFSSIQDAHRRTRISLKTLEGFAY